MSKKTHTKKRNPRSNIFERLYFTFIVFIPFIYSENLIDPVLLPRQLFLSVFLTIISIIFYIKIKKRNSELAFGYILILTILVIKGLKLKNIFRVNNIINTG